MTNNNEQNEQPEHNQPTDSDAVQKKQKKSVSVSVKDLGVTGGAGVMPDATGYTPNVPKQEPSELETIDRASLTAGKSNTRLGVESKRTREILEEPRWRSGESQAIDRNTTASNFQASNFQASNKTASAFCTGQMNNPTNSGLESTDSKSEADEEAVQMNKTGEGDKGEGSDRAGPHQ